MHSNSALSLVPESSSASRRALLMSYVSYLMSSRPLRPFILTTGYCLVIFEGPKKRTKRRDVLRPCRGISESWEGCRGLKQEEEEGMMV